MERIAAVVVTYNRRALLVDCIEALRNQSQKIDSIFVINNNSTDGTGNWLAEQKDLEIINQENLGGAGGFNTGMKIAFQAGFDWIWVMDDDVEPKSNALFELLSYKNIAKCIHPGRIFLDNSAVEFYYELNTSNGMIEQKSINKESFLDDYIYTNTACFEGMLIHSSIINKIGFPDPAFFIVGDDTLYGYKVSKVSNIIFLKKALLIKKILPKMIATSKKNQISPSSKFYYYRFRNQFLLNRELIEDKKLVKFFAYYAYYYSAFSLTINMILKAKMKHLRDLWKGILYNFFNGYTS